MNDQYYNFESNRLKSFKNWNIQYIDKRLLALFGFYYYGPSDLVKCNFCNVEIGYWQEGDDILTDHKRWSPHCKLINRAETDNKPIDEAILEASLPPKPTPDCCGIEISSTLEQEFTRNLNLLLDDQAELLNENLPTSMTISEQIMEQNTLIRSIENNSNFSLVQMYSNRDDNRGASIPNPIYSEFATKISRIKSYKNWPISKKPKPEELSEAGFFYVGDGDKVQCFSCLGGLKDWQENDSPWDQHVKWYGKCRYVQLMMGKNLAQCFKILDKDTKNSQNDEKDAKICKVCYENEYNTVFLPCSHVVACLTCASSVKSCPVCQAVFTKILKIHLT